MWFIVRHGETLQNVKRIIQGHSPSMLTLCGIDQIKSIGYRIKDMKEDFKNYKLIVSPMIRTKHSMQILQEILGLTNMQYIEEEMLSEIDTGATTNMFEKEAKNKYPEVWNIDNYLDRKYPNGESNEDVYNRVAKFCNKYKNEKNLIIVSHSGVIRCLRNILLNRDRRNIDYDMLNQNYFYLWNGNELKEL